MRFLSAVIIIVMLAVGLSYSQVTTGSLAGRVLDSKNAPLKSATVTAIHVPSGTKYGAIVRADGRFNIMGMRVGGPYSVTATFTGYERRTFDNVQIQLGNTTDLKFELVEAGVRTEEVVVIGKQDAVFNSERTGAATTITTQNISVLPTISRRIGDFTRLTPQAKTNIFGTYNYGGQDDRMNNITVDGSYLNNSFGLSGEPGGRTGVAPVSIDALEQIQINVAPYDVRQGNFTGAGVNMVTKSGTNDFSGSLYYQTRNENFVGTQAMNSTFNPGKFSYNLIGASIGGPVIKDKLFFFANFEKEAFTSPGTNYLANNGNDPIGGNVTRVMKSDLDNLSTFLSEKFGYQTGGYQGYDFETPATRLSLKFDYNVDEDNKLTLRYNHLDSKSDQLASNSSSLGFGNRRTSVNALNFQNSNYAILENIRSIIGEWNSVVSDNMTNNLIVGYRFHDESREQPGTLFPMVDILDEGSTYTTFGTEPFTPSNKLTYSTLQFINNFSIFLNNHTLLFGLSVERYESENVFFPGSQSAYVYNSLDDFYADANDYLSNPNRTTSPVELRRFQYRYSNIKGQVEPVQPLKVLYAGIYAQDDWKVLDNFNLTAGIRMDIPFFSETGYENKEANDLTFKDENGNDVKYQTQKLPDASPLFSPRLGFNWDVFKNKTTQLRGGTGIFTGQPAFVWISNQIGNNGILTGFERKDNTKDRPFNPNPNAYKPSESEITGAPAANYELALTDPNFKFPQIWRTNLAVDQKLPIFDLIGGIEFIYNKDVNGVYYINANLSAPNAKFAGPDTRDRWTASNKIHSKIDNAIVLKNQNEGYSYSIAATLERQMTEGLYGKLGYAYGVSKNTVDAGSIAFGSWNNNQHANNPNNPGLGFTAYTPDNRFFAALSYRLDYFNIGATTISLFFDTYNEGRNSYVYGGDFNGDGGTSNDLIYIPKDKSEMYFQEYTVNVKDAQGTNVPVTITAAQQADAFEAFIQQDEYLSANRGKSAERNGVIYPMVSRLDLGVSQEFYANLLGKRNAIELRLDIINFTNLLNKDWGVGQTLVSNQPLIPQKSGTDNLPVYRMRTTKVTTEGATFLNKSFTNTANLNDVYRLQLTLRYKFN